MAGAEKAIVAMTRALSRLGGDTPGVLVLDEPTAPLERRSVEMLFDSVRKLRDRGCGVLFVSHDVGEVMSLCDSVSVLRDGELVLETEVAGLTEDDLVRAIVGKDIGELYPETTESIESPIVLSVRDLHGRVIKGMSFDLRKGEILGVTGLAAMGQDELPALIFGSAPRAKGEIRLFDEDLEPSPRNCLDRGLAMLPADRKGLAAYPWASLTENLTLPVLGRYFRGGWLRSDSEREDVSAVLDEFKVVPPEPDLFLGQLSGGNQQKALLGKWLRLFRNAQVMVLHEPTQGVDIGARQEIFRTVTESVAEGLSVIYVSTEYEDLAHLCDRVLVLRFGEVATELSKGALDGARIATAAVGSPSV